jgi:F-type H+/Na+-transporting ATPase subunit alpha
MASWADEISAIIEKNIAGFGVSETATASVGTVIAVQDGIARVYGLQDVKYLELVEFPRTGIMGMAFNLEEETVSCTILGEFSHIREDDEVRTTGRVISVPVGDALIGRVVNPLGEPLDNKGPIVTDKFRPVERVAPGVITRQSVNTPVQTGLKAIDSMIPIGRGQRELIIGDRQTGKTAIAIDTIINRRARTCCVFMLQSARRTHRWHVPWQSWSNTAQWSIPFW